MSCEEEARLLFSASWWWAAGRPIQSSLHPTRPVWLPAAFLTGRPVSVEREWVQ
jgi:hypothetical protein